MNRIEQVHDNRLPRPAPDYEWETLSDGNQGGMRICQIDDHRLVVNLKHTGDITAEVFHNGKTVFEMTVHDEGTISSLQNALEQAYESL